MDLNAPLGMRPPPPEPQPRRPIRSVVALSAGLAAVGALAAVGVYLSTGDPHGGEPYGVAAISPATPKPIRPVDPAPVVSAPVDLAPVDSAPTGSLPPAPRITDLAQPGTPAAQPGGGPLVIDVAKVLAERGQQGGASKSTLIAPAATQAASTQAALTQPGPIQAGPIQPGPMNVAPSPDAARGEAKIAILVAGMGLSQSATRTATEIMPAAVTFAFVPYGDTIAVAVAAAKAKGHEVLLQMPMQDAGAPAPGPYAMHAGEPGPEVAVDAAWAFGRFSGYAGVSNFLGAAVTSDKPVMETLLRAVGARELFYVDDGTSRRSLGPSLAQQQGLPAARADLVLDATTDPAAVRANLERLASIATRKGTAIGLASGLPDHLAAIASFATGLRARHIALVPVGTLVARTPSVAVAQ